MKKMFVLMVASMMSHFVIAQVNEGAEASSNKTNPFLPADKGHHRGDRHARKEMMKALNLSEEQKSQLKEMRIADKEKRSAILNDSKLSEEQKHQQLRELHNEQARNMQGILTDNQKAKMKEARGKMRSEYKTNPDKIHPKRMQDDKSPATEPVNQ
jgi:Spy/CpxP family protein refolding chaperone